MAKQRTQDTPSPKHGQGGHYGHERHEPHVIPAGERAPDFSLKSTPDQAVTLDDFRGRRLVLAFYPGDWSPVCGDQLALYNEILPEFHRLGAELVGISVDSAWSHMAYAQQRNLHFPLLSDFEPKGAVARSYGAYREGDGFAERALFVIDEEGIVRWSYCSPVGVNPGADGILAALEALPGEGGEAADQAAAASATGAAVPPAHRTPESEAAREAR
ncbi:MAG: peroxiredoxin [Gemmatimonadaceae bacterium]